MYLLRRSRNLLLPLLAFAALGVGVVAVEFIATRGRTPSISGERAVASLEKLRLGGVDQWVLIRGHDRNNPVLLFLHGGPGMPAMFLAHAFQRDLERDFVVVHWDRRGAGKSFEAADPLEQLTVRQTLDDTFELTTTLRKRFKQNRILLVGHSWGSYLGLLAIREHPEYYAAYIGMGQLAGSRAEVRLQRREFLTRDGSLTGNTDLLSRLASGGDPTEDDLFRHAAELYHARSFWPILRTGLFAPEYTLWDVLNVKRGADLVGREMKYNVLPKPLDGEIPAFEVPVFFLLGRHDYNTPSSIAANYLERLRAPLKGLVWFEQSAHFPFFEEPLRFHEEMVRVDLSVRKFWAAAHLNEVGGRPAVAPPITAMERTASGRHSSPGR
jgi:pimeloyl-ACP methyl ester carboxylesterase